MNEEARRAAEARDLQKLNAASALLDRILILLQEMYRLAQRAEQEDCPPAERILLQRDLEGLRGRIDRLTDQYEREYGELPPLNGAEERGNYGDETGADTTGGTIYRF